MEVLLDRQRELQQRREHLRQSISQEARCPRRDWHAEFAWDARALKLLREVFGLKDYRWDAAHSLPPRQQPTCLAGATREALQAKPAGGYQCDYVWTRCAVPAAKRGR